MPSCSPTVILAGGEAPLERGTFYGANPNRFVPGPINGALFDACLRYSLTARL